MQHDLLFRLADSGKMVVLINLNPAARKFVTDSFFDLAERILAFMILHNNPDGLSFDIGRIITLRSDDFAWLAGSVGNYMRGDISHISLIREWSRLNMSYEESQFGDHINLMVRIGNVLREKPHRPDEPELQRAFIEARPLPHREDGNMEGIMKCL